MSPQVQQLSAWERGALPSATWLGLFIAIEIISQLLLLVMDQSVFRLPLRMATYGTSLAYVFLIPNRKRPHPAMGVALIVIAIYCLSLFNESTRFAPGIAQIVLTTAVLAPFFWVPRLAISLGTLKRLFTIVWLFNVCSATLGVLQVQYPGRFDQAYSEVLVQAKKGQVAQTYAIVNAKGELAQRPMGLSDAPGAAGVHGVFAVVLGLAGILIVQSWVAKVLISGGIIAGLAVMFLSQMRVLTVMLVISVATLLVVLWLRRDRRLVSMLVFAPALTLGGFLLAYEVGGEAMAKRLGTLVSGSAGDVFYSNRGQFLETTLGKDVPQYPLGAGLGRWGMTNAYLAKEVDPMRPTLWAEIQWTGWVYDGGIPLVLAYSTIFIAACFTLWRLTAPSPDTDLPAAAAVVLAYTVGGIAATFCFPIFHSQTGLDIWLLNGALYAAMGSSTGQPAVPVDTRLTA